MTEHATARGGSRLEQWRLAAGLSRSEMCDLTGLSRSMLSRVERGERRLAPLTKAKLARRLRVPMRELFDVAPLDLNESGD